MISFSTGDVASQKQLSAWQEIMSDVYYSLEIKRDLGESLRGTIRQYDIGAISITTFDSDEQRVFRTKPRIAVDPDDSFVFVTPVSKELYFSQAGRSGIVPPGGYALINTSEFYELSCPDGFVNWTVKIPGQELRRRIPDIEDYCACRFPNNLAMARVARHHIRNLALTFSDRRPPNEGALAANLIDLIALVVSSEPDNGGTESHSHYRTRRRVMDYVRQKLHDPELNPKRIASDNGISLSYLHKLFHAANMTVGEYILAERLQAAYESLAAADKGKVTVAEAAYSAGFRNLSHFSRVFSQKYKVPPSVVRKQPT